MGDIFYEDDAEGVWDECPQEVTLCQQDSAGDDG